MGRKPRLERNWDASLPVTAPTCISASKRSRKLLPFRAGVICGMPNKHETARIHPAGPSADSLGGGSETSQAVNIVTLSDEHYVQHLSVMLVSLFENNQNHVVNVFAIIPKDMPEAILMKIRTSVKGFERNLHFCKIERNTVDELPVFGYLTTAAYYRYFIGEILPKDIHKVIYLDPDIIVRGDIGELWRACLGNSVVGAVPDSAMTSPELYLKLQRKLGLRPDAPYFNSGVLLVDLDRWRETGVGLDAFQFARDQTDRMTFTEQCGLNWALRDRWMPLPECWNLQTGMVARIRWGFMDYTRDAKKRARAAKIVHFTANSKPWHYMNNHPLKREYFTYLGLTQWKDYKYSDYSLRNVIRKNLYRFAPFTLRLHYMMRERFPSWRRLVSASS